MASTRKSKTVNKRISKVNEDFLDKDGATGNKNKNRKRKLSDMLGSQWSKDELGRFYEAYRKYGKDWKKVAVAVRNRSVEMVEALYNMNRAYLSLPEGTASVIGLIAMMTDHYNVMEGSESEHESNDIPGVSRKPQKRGRGKSQVTSSKGMDTNAPDLLNSPSIASNLGCLSLLKKKRSGGPLCDLLIGTQPRAVGKRTPRVPVSYYGKHDREQFVPSNKRVSKSDLDAHDDEAAHGVVLVLAEALQRGSSPQVSHAPVRRTELIRPSSARNRTQKQIGSKLEGNLERREAGNGYYTRDSSYMMDIEGVGNVEVNKRGKKFHGKKLKNQDVENNQFDDVREACSGTEEELNISSVKQKGEDEVRDSKYDWSSPRGQRKRSRPLLFEDEISAIDALQTLADLSLKLPPASTVESESSVQFNEEKRPSAIADKSSIPEISSTSRQRDKSKVLGAKERAQHSISGFNRSVIKNAKLGKDSASHVCSVPDAKKLSSQTITKVPKQTRKSVETMLQSQRNEAPTNSLLGEPQNTEVLPEDGKKLAVNAKQVGAPDFLLKQGKLFGPSDRSSPIADALIPGTATSSVGLSVNQVNLPTKLRSRRKTAVQKALVHKEVNAPEKISKSSLDSRTLDVKEKLSRCLSSQMLRRWCAYEWFYSAIDYPWFARKEFVEYMNHVGLGKVSTLTRVEWGVIRSSLGKPRRLSQQFLREEKEKLEHYRESVRTHYTELKTGIREGLPTDLARPLSVGQRVIACHPRTRDFYDGSVLTVYRNRCRIQFDRAELGVEFVMDIDCMPLNPLENIPEALKRQNTTADRSCENINEPRLSNPSKDWKTGGYIADSISQISSPHPLNTLLMQAKGDTVDGISQAKAAANEICNAQKEAYTQPCTLAQIQAREADVRALSELTRALEKKEALVRELRRMNDEVYQNQTDGDSSLKDCDPFKRQYATVFIQLKETNDQVSSALLCLRQQNTYQGNSTPPLLKPKVGSGAPFETIDEVDQSAFLSQESGSHVTEILERTGSRAQMLVSTAVQTLSSLEEGEDVLLSLNEAVGAINHHNATDSGISTLISSISADRVNVSFPQNDSANSSQPTNAATANGTDHDNILDKIEVYTPKALISSCVATMLMVLRCLDRQHPPAEIAQIIDSAFTRMQPYCSPSLSVYREIEMCMGIMRNQILARTPT